MSRSGAERLDHATLAAEGQIRYHQGPMVNRRRVLGALSLGLLVAPGFGHAQPPRLFRIGFLGNSTAALEANLVEPFRDGLRELGYEEGRNIRIEYRWAEANYERFPALINELIALNVDVIVAAGTPPALAVKKTTASVPMVAVAIGDPVGTGVVASLARPGGNITGLTSIAADLEGKRLELLRQVLPELSHVAVLWNPLSPFSVVAEREAQAAARTLRMKVSSLGVRTSQELDDALATFARERPGALLVVADRVFLHNRSRIVSVSAQLRLPGVYAYRELVEAGGFMSYGPSYADMHRRAATYVDKILKGAKPGDLPIERPRKFELIINLKTAKALGLTIPPSLLVRADQIID
ncbi:MAG: ABC transporter substrate-binding protein [Candidatus Rokuibacteriota bacterium]